MKLVCMFALFNLILNAAYAMELPTGKITIKAVDEAGVPVVGANASITFEVPKLGKQGLSFIAEKGVTERSGLFAAAHTTTGSIAFSIRKDGYYKSSGMYRFSQRQANLWVPWNPELTLLFRKIEKPVPMYARDTQMSGLEIPKLGKAVGFDLIEYDWMPPHGKGKHADMIFKVDKRIVNDEDFDSALTITFPNKHDGIQRVKEERSFGSDFKLPRFAPKTGYKQKLARIRRAVPGKPVESDYAEDNNYIFRVRSEKKTGKLFRAMYGKIQGDIQIAPRDRKTAAILFKYYLNPDYSRNLEFDPTKNLFENLRDLERGGL